MTALDQLHQHRVPLNQPHQGLDNLTPIQFAAKHGETAFLDEQLSSLNETEKRAVLTVKNEGGGLTPLHFAAIYGHVEAVKMLLSHHAPTDSLTTLQQLPIQCALNQNTLKPVIIELFNALNNDKNNLRHGNFNGDTVAHLAAELDIPELLAIIQQENGSVLNKKNNQSRTPFLVAVLNNSIASIAFLLKTTSMSIKDSRHRNGLHYAALYGTTDCLTMVSPYFDVNVKDGEGKTPLAFLNDVEHSEKINILTEHAMDSSESSSRPR